MSELDIFKTGVSVLYDVYIMLRGWRLCDNNKKSTLRSFSASLTVERLYDMI